MDNNEIEKTKELLDNVYKIDLTIETMRKEIEYWKNQKNDDEQQYISTLKNEIKNLQDTKIQVSKAINKLSDYFARIIFTRRYILNEKWTSVVNGLGGMSVRNAHYIHDEFIIELTKLLKGAV